MQYMLSPTKYHMSTKRGHSSCKCNQLACDNARTLFFWKSFFNRKTFYRVSIYLRDMKTKRQININLTSSSILHHKITQPSNGQALGGH
ncbi:hypothetical protein CEXT_575501 [Caerostris extrusa]|uniref:Uncharacterized protein n=1 Tax=Caerostris extrusa TaxID=172846 RepID=A0AAV4MIW2_CAEEX|nr:hypothetical protein CEXT_575501 [Caerostris extrusa]